MSKQLLLLPIFSCSKSGNWTLSLWFNKGISLESLCTLMTKDLFKTKIIEHMKHSLLIRVIHVYNSAPIWRAHVKWLSLLILISFSEFRFIYHKNSFLQCNLNVVIKPLSQLKGIFPLIIESRFGIKLRPTLVEFDFKIAKVVCLEVNVWLKFWIKINTKNC